MRWSELIFMALMFAILLAFLLACLMTVREIRGATATRSVPILETPKSSGLLVPPPPW